MGLAPRARGNASGAESVCGLCRAQVATVVGMLSERGRLTLQDEDVIRGAHAAFERTRSSGFTDCLIVEAARKAGNLPVGAFDRTMSRIEAGMRFDLDVRIAGQP